MRNLLWFLVLFLILTIQSGILAPLGIFPINLILVTVVAAVIFSDFSQGLIITIMGGLLLDFASGSPDGLQTMSLLATFGVLHLVLREFLTREPNRYVFAATVFGGTLAYFVAFLFINRFFGFLHITIRPDLRFTLTTQMPLTMIWNLVFTYPIMRLYIFVQNMVSKLPQHEQPIRTS